jgi:uncharacterized GH25 family protein
MKRILLAAAIALAPAVAQAHDWWIVNYADGTCISGAADAAKLGFTQPVTPYNFEQGLRAEGDFDYIKIVRNRSGEIVVVMVAATNGSAMVFIPSLADCRAWLELNKQDIGTKQDLN